MSDEISSAELEALVQSTGVQLPGPIPVPVHESPLSPPLPSAAASPHPEAHEKGASGSGGFTPLTQAPESALDVGLGLLFDVPLRVSIELGRIQMSLQQVLALGRGSIVELDRLAGEPVDILVNDKLIGRGEVVVVDENFGVKITELIEPKG